MQNAIIKDLLVALADHDADTAQHSWRVRGHARRLARALGLSLQRRNNISLGALLHDVGKLDVPADILQKSGPLTPTERRVVECHPAAGSRLLTRAALDPEALAAVLWHHERWDGTGYPDSLKGTRIPMSARIVSVADVYDALTTERPYRSRPLRPEDALGHLRTHSGSQFDPTVVLAFVALMTPRGEGSEVAGKEKHANDRKKSLGSPS